MDCSPSSIEPRWTVPPVRYPEYFTKSCMARVDQSWNASLMRAGWPPRDNGTRGRMLLNQIALHWCGGDVEAARWVLARAWLRERTLRYGRAAALCVPVLLLLGVTWTSVIASVSLLIMTRTSADWGGRLEARWPHDAKTHQLVLKRFGPDLPAAVLKDEHARSQLLPRMSDTELDTLDRLLGEWDGSVAELIQVARALS